MPRVRKTDSEASKSEIRWKLGAYIRLSREDNVKSDNDSNSVKNQKAMLAEYYTNHLHEFDSVEYYVDDGFTGTDSNRDGFRKLISDIENKKINAIVFKDLSRFSRNTADADHYLHYHFPLYDVRTICFEPFIDSYKDPDSLTNIAVPITNVINDNFCLQTSKKIRQVFDYKRRKGDFIGAFAPYGYAKDPQNKNRLIIDEEAAAIVQNIFEWYVQGMSKMGISRKLNDLGISNPAKYKREKGLKYCNPSDPDSKSSLWDSNSIYRILENEMYIGVMVQGKQKVKSYKVHTRVTTSKDDWFFVEGTHEPIISRELFEKAVALKKKDTRVCKGKSEVSLFSGFLKCPDCGKAMHKQSAGNHVYYCCRTYKMQSKEACTKHTIRHDRLESAVLTAIQHQMDLVLSMRDLVSEISTAPVVQNRSIQLDKAAEAKERELAKVNRYLRNLYQDMCDELISKQEYQDMRADYTEQANQIIAVIESLNEQRRIAGQGTKEDHPALSAFVKHGNFKSLTRELLLALVDCIYVKEGSGIAIQFKFHDHFERIREFIKINGKEPIDQHVGKITA